MTTGLSLSTTFLLSSSDSDSDEDVLELLDDRLDALDGGLTGGCAITCSPEELDEVESEDDLLP